MCDSYVIGIDIGGTNFRIGAVYPDNQIREFRKVSIKDIFTSEYPLEDLVGYIRGYIKEPQILGEAEAVAIGFPATVNKERTCVVQAPNIKYMENLPVVEYLENNLQLPVHIERDVCMTVCYDMEKLEIPQKGILAAIYYGTGIGNVICINGVPLLGKDGVAGELGHIPVPGSAEVCGCGNMGCMENIAGGKFLAKLCQEKYPHIYIGDIFSKCGEKQDIIDFVDRMAIAAATEINILNPDYIIIGGGVPNMKNFPVALLDQKIHEHVRKPYPEKSLDIIYASDDDMKSVAGAGIFARRKKGE